jgi:hypothetical protein
VRALRDAGLSSGLGKCIAETFLGERQPARAADPIQIASRADLERSLQRRQNREGDGDCLAALLGPKFYDARHAVVFIPRILFVLAADHGGVAATRTGI